MELLEDKPKNFSILWSKFLNKLYRYRLLLKRRWWVIFLTTSLGVGGMAWWASNQPPLFQSTSRMMVSGKLTIPEGATYSEEAGNFFGTQMELMKSDEVRQRAQSHVAALRPELTSTPVKLEVAQVRNASIFVLSATGSEPVYIQAFLDAVMEEYIGSKKEIRSEKSDTTVTAITAELVRVEKELRSGEEELIAFQKNNNVGFLEQEGNSAATYLSSLNRQIADLKTEFDLLKLLNVDQMLDRAKKEAEQGVEGASQGNVVRGTGPDTEYLRAKQQIEVLKAQREDFAKVLRPAHPTMIELNQEIAKHETMIATFRNQSIEQIKNRRDGIALQIQNLEKVAKEWEVKALNLSQGIAEFNRIKSKVERTKGIYERLLTSLRSVDVTKRIDQDSVTSLSKASPSVSIQPGKLMVLLVGLGGGLVIGLLILILLDLIDDRMTSFLEYQGNFEEPVLAQISREKNKGNIPHIKKEDERHSFAESFRSLRSAIFYLPDVPTPPKTILVTSSVPNEGKTTVATNLAVTLAFANSRVLLIDADVRRGDLHGAFGLENARGLSDVLRGEAAAADCILTTPVENLSLLPRGVSRGHPGERFLSTTVDEVLAELCREYDFIILDSAPVMVADDTSSLAPKLDACVYVVRFSFTSARVSRRALETLKSRQANVIGVVCNEVHSAMPEYYYYYNYAEYYGAKEKAKT